MQEKDKKWPYGDWTLCCYLLLLNLQLKASLAIYNLNCIVILD